MNKRWNTIYVAVLLANLAYVIIFYVITSLYAAD